MVASLFIFGGSAVAKGVTAVDPEESEVQYSLARIAANAHDYASALAQAEIAAQLDPNNVEALELTVEAANRLGRAQLAEEAGQKLREARRRQETLKKIGDQLRWAINDMETERWKLAHQRLEYVTQAASIEPSISRDIVNEAQLRLGMAYLAQSDLSRAANTLARAGGSYRQQGKVVLGNYFLQRGYLSEALVRFEAAARAPEDGRDEALTQASERAAQKLRSFSLGVRGSALVTYDSNPFGLPVGRKAYTDGSPNSNTASALNLTGLVRSPIHPRHPWFYSVFLGTSQYRSIPQGTRRQLDGESASAGAALTAARYRLGTVQLRYDFTYGQTPALRSGGEYRYRAAYRLHTVNLDYSREVTAFWRAAVNGHVHSSDFVTANDTGSADRSGTTLGGHFYSDLRISSRWLYPSIKVGYNANRAVGASACWRSVFGQVSNFFQLGKSGAELELSLAYESKVFYRDPTGRKDVVWRGGLAVLAPIVPRLSALGQTSYSITRSTDGFYRQRRWVISSGLAFSF